jgi:ATP-dependent DNA helicase RecG
MFLTGDIERYGTGILEIIKLTKEADLIAPEFIINEGFKVILWRPSATAKAIHDTIHDTAHDTIHDTIHDSKFISIENLPHRLVWFLNSAMSRDELMAALELKNRDNFQKTYIKPAVEDGLIELTLPDKKTSKNQKYRLTKKGKLVLKKLKGND